MTTPKKTGRKPRQPGDPIKSRPKSLAGETVFVNAAMTSQERDKLRSWAEKQGIPSVSAAIRELIKTIQ
ncbi:hypothetical protein GC170_20415 [bacterium]|nr:hypothetical protein [bacterium]